jgi:hypothetical protein
MPYIGTKPSTANFSDLNGAKLILDADADTSITADTDDQIDIEIAGSDELKITAAMIAPATADGSALGGASNEWSDLYLADSSVIYFGADQDVTVTHDPDDGLFLKSIATADNNPVLLTLQTGETDMAANDVMGKISFQAPDEGTGTDAILVAAAIQARAEGDFSSSSNATSIDFMTGASEAAATKWSITSAGSFLNAGTNTIDMNAGELILDADADTSITADTDDTIDIKIAGADDFQFTANTFTALSGSTVTIASGATLALDGTSTIVVLAQAGATANVTGNGTEYTVALTSELTDTGSDFATPTFTAPSTGAYLICGAIGISGWSGTPTNARNRIVTSNRTYDLNFGNWAGFAGGSDLIGHSFSMICDMDASDTAHLTVYVTGIGADSLDISAGSTWLSITKVG